MSVESNFSPIFPAKVAFLCVDVQNRGTIGRIICEFTTSPRKVDGHRFSRFSKFRLFFVTIRMSSVGLQLFQSAWAQARRRKVAGAIAR